MAGSDDANDNGGPEPGTGRKLLWFVGLWLAGVMVLGIIAYGIRLFIGT
ncbi:DUF2474 family protein [Emcibacter nanhaiensis]|uniref:DUF2474 family protein n=1 Tax=Emcibacter nanhaiensis TaxID=1505037 RepID=A0A501PP21_9PROT|nr:DUF2474 family protein [Emcibacter nanhaiensis]TPD61734.1 DUF2474 family protein [Emcibacter nanhaiensis]